MLRRQGWAREDDALLQQLYPDLSDSDVAQHMQRTLWSIQARAKRLHLTKNAEYRTALDQAHGLRLRQRNLTYHVNHHYFSHVTTHEQAYWLGWLWSDGYVRQQGESYRIELELHKDDVNILEQFKVAVEADYPIRFRRDSARLCVISRQMFRDLGECGVIPQKSKLATRPNIDESFAADFIRGVFDGDGSISKNRHPQVVIIGTEAFCCWLQSVTQRAIGAGGSVTLKKNATFWWILSGRNNLSAFAQWIYAPYRNGERVICLARKYQRFIEAGLLSSSHPGCDLEKGNKLGLFYAQLTYEQEPDHQPLVVGVDPGSKFEGVSVVGTKDTVLNLMVEAPDHVKKAVETRRTMRRARRFRKWRRPRRFDNRLTRKNRIPPSTRSRWEAKARLIRQLLTILPLTDVAAVTRKGKAGKWNRSFSPVQVGKEYFYCLLREMGLTVHLTEGWQTKALREKSGLKKTKSKSKQSFDSHAVDSWVLAASVSGAQKPSDTRVWYVVPAVLNRRKLHMLQASKGGKRRPQGGTRSLGLKRGTLVRHPTYGLAAVGGFDRKKHTISLHAYRTNKRLTQGAKVKDCRVLTWVAWRSWLVKEQVTNKGKGSTPPTP